MDPRDKWQVNEEALHDHVRDMRGARGSPPPETRAESEFALPRWFKWTLITIATFIVLVMWLASRYSPEDHQRDAAAAEAERMCAKMMADAQLGAERRNTRAMCDDLLRRFGKTLPP